MAVDHLTQIPNVPSKADAVPGMAHFANTGPPDTYCRTCIFWGYQQGVRRHGGCRKYQELMHRDGPKVRASTPSCRYYEEAAR
jgi:hypothetical protein